MQAFDVFVVGGGHGGAQAAMVLRQQGFEGTTANRRRGTRTPYERPPLSKEYLAGDCAEQRNAFARDAWIRLESVQNANDQASVVAKAIAGGTDEYHAVPWFWSSQYHLRLQTVGLSIGHDQVVVRGDPSVRSFSLIYLREGGVIALDCVNATRDYVQGRSLVTAGAVVAPEALADTSRPLKELAQAA